MCYILCIMYCVLHIMHYILHIACYTLPVIHYLLYITCYMLYILLYIILYMLYIIYAIYLPTYMLWNITSSITSHNRSRTERTRVCAPRRQMVQGPPRWIRAAPPGGLPMGSSSSRLTPWHTFWGIFWPQKQSEAACYEQTLPSQGRDRCLAARWIFVWMPRKRLHDRNNYKRVMKITPPPPRSSEVLRVQLRDKRKQSGDTLGSASLRKNVLPLLSLPNCNGLGNQA